MARYRLLIKPSALKELEAIPSKKDRRRLVECLLMLADHPRPPGCEKLSGQDKYRLRQGRYRILYAIEDDNLEVYVTKIAHRKDIYR